MRVYTINVSGGLHALKEALKGLDAWTYSDAEGCINVIRVERVKALPGHLDALIKVTHRPVGRRMWSDLYRFEFQQVGAEIVVVAQRISGMGRTDPDFIIDALLKLVAFQGSSPQLNA